MKDIKLLIADHSERFSSDVKSYLEHMPGIHVVGVCGEGEDAVEFIRSNHPDAVLLELILGGLDGISVLKTFSGMPAPPVFIVCTEFCNDVSIRRARQYGASCFLSKPVSRQALYDAIVESVNSIAQSLLRDERPSIELTQKAGLSIESILVESGIPRHSAGYRYLCDAALLAHQNPASLFAITKVLYPDIARLNASTPERVERDIRTAILYAYQHSDLTINGARPTNLEFIKLVTGRMNEPAQQI